MEEIWSGLLQAFELIITLDPEVVGITARSLYISLASVFLSSLIDIPLGAMIESREFWGKRGIISLIHTLYSLPTVTVGLLVYLILSRN
ncbi:MAG TPA: ABC transporter permease, partial [Methanothrix sp.]|nr:ABC transporter permease [Methanothrix sp.]